MSEQLYEAYAAAYERSQVIWYACIDRGMTLAEVDIDDVYCEAAADCQRAYSNWVKARMKGYGYA